MTNLPNTTQATISALPDWHKHRGTLADIVSVEGRGLHTGKKCHVTLMPAPANTGVIFRRLPDSGNPIDVPADLQLRYSQPLCTALKDEQGTIIRTVEHLLAALRACEIDDVIVEMDEEELPILDGSAKPWISAIGATNRVDLDTPRQFIQVTEPVEWAKNKHHLRLEPIDQPAFEADVEMEVPRLGTWTWQGTITPEYFREEVSAARSFGNALHALPGILYGFYKGMPMLRGARPWSAAAILGPWVIGGKRMPDEFVRHKLVDMLGDYALIGPPILGRIIAKHPTHKANAALMRTLLSQPDSWQLVEVE